MSKTIYRVAKNNNFEIPVKININQISRLTLLPRVDKVKKTTYEVGHRPLDKSDNPTVFFLEDADYVGTVASTITDDMRDIYVIKDEKDPTKKCFLIIDSLLFLPNADMPKQFTVNGVISGVIDTRLDLSTRTPLSANYLDEYGITDTVKTLKKIHVRLLSLPGLGDGSLYDSTEIYTGIGQYNSSSEQPAQLIVLGDVEEVFADQTKPLPISHVAKEDELNYAYTSPYMRKVTSGDVCIPLNF